MKLIFNGIKLIYGRPNLKNAEARLKINGVSKIFFYCNKDGLFSVTPIKGIDDKQTSYDDTEERKALEQAAKVLFG